jgi:putative membrane protein insertion efficiency factor
MHHAHRGILTSTLLAAISLYRRVVSPFLPSACRFHPTCSRYAAEAIEIHGPWRGTWMAIKRVGKCHPFHPGGEDPVT